MGDRFNFSGRVAPAPHRSIAKTLTRVLTITVLTITVLGLVVARPAVAVDFTRDVRPILVDHCFACHGPDAETRAAGLRLDQVAGIDSVMDTARPKRRQLIHRILSRDADTIMPPPSHHRPLSAADTQTLQQWVADGGHAATHWALRPIEPLRRSGAKVGDQAEASRSSTTDNDHDSDQTIDRFIDQRIVAAGLTAMPPADDGELVRRLHLDLTGLPPTPARAHRFVEDDRDDKVDRLIDELLDSPEFGRHFGRHWLDLVRYADTHGLHLDNRRDMWLYRDWVIDALNDNMPYDRFITKQLAGDLLPGATQDDQIASGFNRLGVTTNEEGSIHEEVRARNCIDRTDAFGTMMLGLTTRCAACHDHKHDPITQSDYYSLLAFFNSLDGSAMDGDAADHPPSLIYKTPRDVRRLAKLDAQIVELDDKLSGPIPSVDAAQRRWQSGQSTAAGGVVPGGNGRSLIGDDSSVCTKHGTVATIAEATLTLSQPASREVVTIRCELPGDVVWQTLRLEIPVAAGVSEPIGWGENGNAVLSEFVVQIRDGDQWIDVPIESAVAIDQPNSDQPNDDSLSFDRAIDGRIDDRTGWGLSNREVNSGFDSASASGSDTTRTVWMATPGLYSAGEMTQVRVQMHFASHQDRHLFRRIRLFATDSPPRIDRSLRITVDPLRRIGPFVLDSASSGYDRPIVEILDRPPADDLVRSYRGKTFQWQPLPIAPVQTHVMDSVLGHHAETVFYAALHSPTATTARLLIDVEGGLIVTLNGEEVHRHRGEHHRFDALSQTVVLPLRRGTNHVHWRSIDHGGGGRLAYAFASMAIDPPDSVWRDPGPHKTPLGSAMPSGTRTRDARVAREYFRRVVCVDPLSLLQISRRSLIRQRGALLDSLPTTLIWKETDPPRPAHILKRGRYDSPGDVAPRRTPSSLPPMPPGAPSNRLGLAQWLVHPSHPLTARVAVNRFWQIVFGTGIVKTSEDFGSQGELPSHPRLLDHLAADFQSDWNVKRLVRRMVRTRAYQRSSAGSDSMRLVDPENRLYARGSRRRLDAEVIRDQALAIGGLLRPRGGGAPVRPPQPAGLWSAVGYTDSDTAVFVPDGGDDRYRRSVYTFWKRTSAPPSMTTFDAPSRESCTARRPRTNTPMQALVLMNEPQFLAAARGLAARGLAARKSPLADRAGRSGQSNPSDPRTLLEDRAAWMFHAATSAMPTRAEMQTMVNLVIDTTDLYADRPDDAQALTGSTDTSEAASEAAWVILATTLLNLDRVLSN